MYPNDGIKQKARMQKRPRLLEKGNILKPVLTLRAVHSTNSEVAEKLRVEASYSREMPSECAIPAFVAGSCLSAWGNRSRMRNASRRPASSSPGNSDCSRRQRNGCPAPRQCQATNLRTAGCNVGPHDPSFCRARELLEMGCLKSQRGRPRMARRQIY